MILRIVTLSLFSVAFVIRANLNTRLPKRINSKWGQSYSCRQRLMRSVPGEFITKQILLDNDVCFRFQQVMCNVLHTA